MKYLVEKGNAIPLCAVNNHHYINYITGEAIEDEHTLNFIEKGKKSKSIKAVDLDLIIYAIYQENAQDISFIGYNYCINGNFNYLDYKKRVLEGSKEKYVIDMLISGDYKQKAIWYSNE